MIPLQGEMMKCALCGKEEKSDPAVESGWRFIQMDEDGYYVCPAELPPDGATKEEYTKAYVRVLGILMRNGKSALMQTVKETLEKVSDTGQAECRLCGHVVTGKDFGEILQKLGEHGERFHNEN